MKKLDLKRQTVCFTGHREIKHKNCANILRGVVDNLVSSGFCYFGCGGARGFDSYAAQVVLDLKREKYPHIHLILVLPFDNQYEAESGWSRQEIEEYHYYKQQASKVVHIGDKYERGIYYKRNRHLVDFSSVCIAYQYKNTGGTAYTTDYANKKGVQVINILQGGK